MEFEIKIKGEIVGGDFRRKLAALREIEGHLRSTLVEDFGGEAWGGYDGPTVENIETERTVI